MAPHGTVIPIQLPPTTIVPNSDLTVASSVSNSISSDYFFKTRRAGKIPSKVEIGKKNAPTIASRRRDFRRAPHLQAVMNRVHERRSIVAESQETKIDDPQELSDLLELFSKYDTILEHLVNKNKNLRNEAEDFPSELSFTSDQVLETLDELRLLGTRTFNRGNGDRCSTLSSGRGDRQARSLSAAPRLRSAEVGSKLSQLQSHTLSKGFQSQHIPDDRSRPRITPQNLNIKERKRQQDIISRFGSFETSEGELPSMSRYGNTTLVSSRTETKTRGLASERRRINPKVGSRGALDAMHRLTEFPPERKFGASINESRYANDIFSTNAISEQAFPSSGTNRFVGNNWFNDFDRPGITATGLVIHKGDKIGSLARDPFSYHNAKSSRVNAGEGSRYQNPYHTNESLNHGRDPPGSARELRLRLTGRYGEPAAPSPQPCLTRSLDDECSSTLATEEESESLLQWSDSTAPQEIMDLYLPDTERNRRLSSIGNGYHLARASRDPPSHGNGRNAISARFAVDVRPGDAPSPAQTLSDLVPEFEREETLRSRQARSRLTVEARDESMSPDILQQKSTKAISLDRRASPPKVSFRRQTKSDGSDLGVLCRTRADGLSVLGKEKVRKRVSESGWREEIQESQDALSAASPMSESRQFFLALSPIRKESLTLPVSGNMVLSGETESQLSSIAPSETARRLKSEIDGAYLYSQELRASQERLRGDLLKIKERYKERDEARNKRAFQFSKKVGSKVNDIGTQKENLPGLHEIPSLSVVQSEDGVIHVDEEAPPSYDQASVEYHIEDGTIYLDDGSDQQSTESPQHSIIVIKDETEDLANEASQRVEIGPRDTRRGVSNKFKADYEENEDSDSGESSTGNSDCSSCPRSDLEVKPPAAANTKNAFDGLEIHTFKPPSLRRQRDRLRVLPQNLISSNCSVSTKSQGGIDCNPVELRVETAADDEGSDDENSAEGVGDDGGTDDENNSVKDSAEAVGMSNIVSTKQPQWDLISGAVMKLQDHCVALPCGLAYL